MNRYAVITKKFPREFVLLQGTGCRWAKCSFCDYFTDTSAAPYDTNREVLQQVTGKYGVLDVINSGSAIELDEETIALLQKTVIDKKIHTIWFEMHWMYRYRLQEFASHFAPAQVKFRCGIETFDAALRTKWNKGVPAHVTPQDVAQYFQGICLLCCTEGESQTRILQDISLAEEYFEYASVNIFNDNTTAIKQDKKLARWFIEEIYPTILSNPKIEILISNTDLGVG